MLGCWTFDQGHMLLLEIITLSSFLFKFMSEAAIDERKRLKKTKKALHQLHCQNKLVECNTKDLHSVTTVTRPCSFNQKERNQYCVNVALVPHHPTTYLPLCAAISISGCFCSHSHQLHLNPGVQSRQLILFYHYRLSAHIIKV